MQKNKGKEDTMASSMIHLAIVQEMRKKVSFRDINRLFLGVILPDGAVAGNSHLKKKIEESINRCFRALQKIRATPQNTDFNQHFSTMLSPWILEST